MAEVVACKGHKARPTCAERFDRFSNLPDPIIHHIFSFLEMNDIARVGTLSKRCRQMYISSPYLKFVSPCSCQGPPNICQEFSDRVDRFLGLRNGLEIRTFCLRWDCYGDDCNMDVSLIDKWVNIAVSCKVEELDLDVGTGLEGPDIQLPLCIFNSRSLRVLKLNLEYHSLKNPAGVLVSLEELSLETLDISEYSLREWISTVCPSLKKLSLIGLEGLQTAVEGLRKLTIISSYLEELTALGLPGNLCEIDISTERLQKLSLDLNSIFPGYCCEMKINAPNLQDLSWKAISPNNVYLSDFKFLKNATVDLSIYDDYVEERTIHRRLAELFQSLSHAKSLQIKIEILEILFLKDHLTVGFDNLQRLVIMADNLRDCHFSVLASLLMGSHNLETLCLKCSESSFRHYHARKLKTKATRVYEQLNGFNDLISDRLNAIEVELKGKGHEVGLLENMLKVATGLKKMTVYYSRENHRKLSKMVSQHSWAASPLPEVILVQREYVPERSHCHVISSTDRRTDQYNRDWLFGSPSDY